MVPYEKREASMRYKPKSVAALHIALGGLPDNMRVEADPNVGVRPTSEGGGVARKSGCSSPTRAFPRKRGNREQGYCLKSIRAKAVANRHEADVSTLLFVWFAARFDLARAYLFLEVWPARQAKNAAAACSRSSALLNLRRGCFGGGTATDVAPLMSSTPRRRIRLRCFIRDQFVRPDITHFLATRALHSKAAGESHGENRRLCL